MTRRRLVGGGALVAGLAIAAVGIGSTGLLPASAGSTGDPSASSTADRATAEVARRTMTIGDTLDGTLGYTGERQVLNGLPGTLTSLPAPGTVLERGDRLYEVDGRRRPVLLYGERPAWRRLEAGVDNGTDIRQLERNLKALGYAHESMKVNRHWDSHTTAAVKRWQKALGMKVDGIVELGEVVFVDGPIRVTELPIDLGSAVGPGAAVLRGTSTERVVSVDLAADRTDLVAVGDTVSVELPNGETVDGTVAEIGAVAEQTTDDFGGAGDPTVELTITVDAPEAATYDRAPVKVGIVRQARENVLAVPVTALVALLEGGYAVERIATDGSSELVAVEPGIFEDGWVEVRGDGLAAGDDVAVPS